MAAIEIDFISHAVYTRLPWFVCIQLQREGLIIVSRHMDMCIPQFALGCGSQESLVLCVRKRVSLRPVQEVCFIGALGC